MSRILREKIKKTKSAGETMFGKNLIPIFFILALTIPGCGNGTPIKAFIEYDKAMRLQDREVIEKISTQNFIDNQLESEMARWSFVPGVAGVPTPVEMRELLNYEQFEKELEAVPYEDGMAIVQDGIDPFDLTKKRIYVFVISAGGWKIDRVIFN